MVKHGVGDVKDYTVGNNQRAVDDHDEDEGDEDDDEDEDEYDEEDGISDVGRAISGQEGVLKGASPTPIVLLPIAHGILHIVVHMLMHVAYLEFLRNPNSYWLSHFCVPSLLLCCLLRKSYCCPFDSA